MIAIALLSLIVSVAVPQPEDVILIGYRGGEVFLFLAAPLPGVDADGAQAFLDVEAAAAFRRMAAAALLDKVEIRVSNAYRSWEQQKQIYHKNAWPIVAKPGWSKHQSGLSVDVRGALKKGVKTKVYYWLARHAARYGFVNDVPSEGWHWTYAPAAIIKQAKNKPNYSRAATNIVVADPIFIDLGEK